MSRGVEKFLDGNKILKGVDISHISFSIVYVCLFIYFVDRQTKVIWNNKMNVCQNETKKVEMWHFKMVVFSIFHIHGYSSLYLQPDIIATKMVFKLTSATEKLFLESKHAMNSLKNATQKENQNNVRTA